MNKFNKRFNSKIKRLKKWQEVLMRLSGFEGLVNSYDGLNQDDVHFIRIIHRLLYECQSIAKERLREVKDDLSIHHGTMEHSQKHGNGTSRKHKRGT